MPKLRIKVFTGAILSLFSSANAGCVFASDKRDLRSIPPHRVRSLSSARAGDGGVPTGGYDAVKKDIVDILTVSQAFFPADFADTVGANYGPLMIRLAWHCSGSYRATDGRGGCDGGRIRHDPEINWPDNVSFGNKFALLTSFLLISDVTTICLFLTNSRPILIKLSRSSSLSRRATDQTYLGAISSFSLAMLQSKVWEARFLDFVAEGSMTLMDLIVSSLALAMNKRSLLRV